MSGRFEFENASCIYLRDERDQLPEVLRILVRVDLEYLADAVKMVPLLQELLLVRCGIALDEILQLGQIRREEDTATHSCRDAASESTKRRGRPG